MKAWTGTDFTTIRCMHIRMSGTAARPHPVGECLRSSLKGRHMYTLIQTQIREYAKLRAKQISRQYTFTHTHTHVLTPCGKPPCVGSGHVVCILQLCKAARPQHIHWSRQTPHVPNTLHLYTSARTGKHLDTRSLLSSQPGRPTRKYKREDATYRIVAAQTQQRHPCLIFSHVVEGNCLLT